MNRSPSPDGPPTVLPLGVVLAGGASRRYGTPKALARLGGSRLVDRVRAALERVVPQPVAIANDPALAAEIGLPFRPDLLPGGGAMAGVHAALAWAAERGRPGALVLACDMPFVAPALLARLLDEALGAGALAVAPESAGRRGVEPLCAWYATALLPTLEERLRRDARSLRGLWADLPLRRIPAAEVAAYGDPELLFLNVNTPAERARAEGLLAAEQEAHAGG